MADRERIANAIRLIEELENEMFHLLEESNARELTMLKNGR